MNFPIQSRRQFLRTSALSTASILGFSSLGSAQQSDPPCTPDLTQSLDHILTNIRKGLPILVEKEEGRYDEAAFEAFSPSSQYSSGNARAMGWLSQLAYEDDRAKIDRILAKWKLKCVGNEGVRDPKSILARPRYLVITGEGVTFIVFAGTDPLSLSEWGLDASAFPNLAGVHAGFADAVRTAWRRISSHYRSAIEQPSIFFAGHSLGGALAILTAQRLFEDQSRTARGVYVFGCPRAGTIWFAPGYNADLGDRTFRLVHGDDLVARLQPLGYRHVGRLLQTGRYQKFGDRKPIDDLTSNEPELSEAAFALAMDTLRRLQDADPVEDAEARRHCLSFDALPSIIGDHVPDRYLYCLTP